MVFGPLPPSLHNRTHRGFVQTSFSATEKQLRIIAQHHSYVPISHLNKTIRLVLCRSICSLNYQSVDWTYCLYFWALKRSSLIFTFPVTGDIVVAGWYTLSVVRVSFTVPEGLNGRMVEVSVQHWVFGVHQFELKEKKVTLSITFISSTNRETHDRGRHKAEVVRSNIKVTTVTQSVL